MTDPRITALVLAAVALAIHLGAIGVTLRLTRQRYAVRLLLGWAVAVYGVTAVWAHPHLQGAQWHFAAFFGAAFAVVLFMYGAVLKALSLRMLMVMAASPTQAATTQQLTDSIIRASFQDRITLLEDKHLITSQGGEFILTPAGAQSAARIRHAQEALNIGSAGFYWD